MAQIFHAAHRFRLGALRDTSLAAKDRYPSCTHCKRVILGNLYEPSYAGSKSPYRSISRSPKRGRAVYHRECTPREIHFTRNFPDTTLDVPHIEALRLQLEALIASKDMAEGLARKQEWAHRHAIWLRDKRQRELLRDWHFCASPPENITAGGSECLLCGSANPGDIYSVAHHSGSDGVRLSAIRIRKGCRGMHRECAEGWIADQLAATDADETIRAANLEAESAKQRLDEAANAVRDAEDELTTAILKYKSSCLIKMKSRPPRH